MAETGENYYRVSGPARLFWSRSRHVPNDDFEFGVSLVSRKGSGADPVISAGLICYPHGALIGGDQTGTWAPLLLDMQTVIETSDTLHTVRASIANGAIPAGTKEVVKAVRIHSGEVFIAQLANEPFGEVVGRVIRHQETVTDNLVQAISEYNAVFGDNAANALTLIRNEANSEFSQSQFVINQEAIFGADAANATAYIDARADDAITTSTLAQNLNSAFGPNAGNALNVIDTRATSAFTSSTQYQNIDAAFGFNASNIQGYVDGRANAVLTSSTLYQNLESEFGPNAANLDIFAQTVADLDGAAVRRTVTGTGGGGSFSYGGFVNPDGSSFFATADQIVNLAGDAFFLLSFDRATLNVPLDVQRGSDIVSLGSPNAAFWVGDPAIPIASRTPQNSTFGSDNGTPLIGGNPYVPGGSLITTGPAASGTASTTALTATADAILTRGNTMRPTVTFTANTFRTYSNPTDVTAGLYTSGSVTLQFQYSINGGSSWTNVGSAQTFAGQMVRSSQRDFENNIYLITETLNWSLELDNSASTASGETVVWRVLATGIGSWSTGHTVSIRLKLQVTET